MINSAMINSAVIDSVVIENFKIENLRYFFVYEDRLPDGVGFPMFGAAHLLWLALLLAGTVLFWRKYAGWSPKAKEAADRSVGLSLVGLIAVRMVYVALIGKLTVYELPLHLCSMAGILCGIHAFFRWDWLGQTLYALCLPGTLLALIFPDWCYYPAIHFITIEGFLFHAGIVLYAGCQMISGRIVPEIKKLWKVLLFLLFAVPPVYWFDVRFCANYMFVRRPSPGSPLEWLAERMGNPGYLYGYALLTVLVLVLMDIGYAAARRMKGRGRK